MAANVKVSYVPYTETVKFDKPNFETGVSEGVRNYLDIKIHNINTKLEVTAMTDGYNQIFTYHDIGADGAITLRQVPQNETVNYTFEIGKKKLLSLTSLLGFWRLFLC